MQMDSIKHPVRLPESMFAVVRYFLPRLLFLPSRHAAQISWGDITVALQDFPDTHLNLAAPQFWQEWMERWSQLGEKHARVADGAPSASTARCCAIGRRLPVSIGRSSCILLMAS